MIPSLEEVLARVPQWSGAKDLKVTPLGGGITNQNYRVETGEGSFVLRISGANTELLGIDREIEYAARHHKPITFLEAVCKKIIWKIREWDEAGIPMEMDDKSFTA
jgi:hypothetical protein